MRSNPGSTKSHYDYAFYLASLGGNIDKSISEARKAVELDPLSGNAHYILGLSLGPTGRGDRRIPICAGNDPNTCVFHYCPCTLIWEKGMLEKALDEVKKGLDLFPQLPLLLWSMGSIYALRGQKEKTRAILDELLERSEKEYVSPAIVALLCADLGETDRAFEFLEKGYEQRDMFFAWIKPFSRFHLSVRDPRFVALLKKMGLEA